MKRTVLCWLIRRCWDFGNLRFKYKWLYNFNVWLVKQQVPCKKCKTNKTRPVDYYCSNCHDLIHSERF